MTHRLKNENKSATTSILNTRIFANKGLYFLITEILELGCSESLKLKPLFNLDTNQIESHIKFRMLNYAIASFL